MLFLFLGLFGGGAVFGGGGRNQASETAPLQITQKTKHMCVFGFPEPEKQKKTITIVCVLHFGAENLYLYRLFLFF